MTKKMLIDAAHPEETRVVIVDSNRVEELDFESRNKRQLRGNVYLARVTRVEPSLQAAFVEYGGNRHGFLAFSEIHPDYYQIPYEDRMALIEAEEAESKEEDEAEDAKAEKPKSKRRASKSKSRSKSKDVDTEDTDEDDSESDEVESDEDETAENSDDERDENVDPDEEDAADAADAEVADEQAKVASTRRKRMSRRRYKIQEVVKRGQILLIQAVKEERGNKGAAMTTYLSLAGRYCVLMPNTPRGGGISRKIANGSDRKRLKSIMSELEVPQGMGVIVRTAGAKRTKVEIKRDYDYLARLWEEIRETTLKSTAPALIHEEGNLVKRSIRDLYNKDIEEVLVQGDEAYKNAKAFIKMLMPSHAKFVKQYKEDIPLFLRYSVERQIEASLDSVVQLKSGGYLVIHPTEALVSVDVNSGRSTKERNVERTALRTNLEAAEEVARQMRLRDLAGLIVIDFIDMDENRNNRAVEKKMKDAISRDRARIQASRISQFGLMEISHCEHCSGVGRKRTIESSALAAVRAVEEFGVRGKAKRICLKTSPDVALYLFNEKRRQKEQQRPKRKARKDNDEDGDTDPDETETESRNNRGDDDSRDEKSKRRGRRGRRGGRGRRNREENRNESENTSDEASTDKPSEDTDSSSKSEGKSNSRRRGRRGPKRDRNESDNNNASENNESANEAAETASDNTEPKAEKRPRSSGRRKAPSRKSSSDDAVEATSADTAASDDNDDAPKRSTAKRAAGRRKAPSRKSDDSGDETAKAAPKRKSRAKKVEAPDADGTSDAASEAKPKRARRKAPAKKAAPAKEATAEKASAKKTTAKKAVPKKAAPKKAAPKKAAPKTTVAKKAAPKAAPKKAAPAKKAAPKKAAPKAAAEKAEKAAATRKAPARKSAPKAEAKPAESQPTASVPHNCLKFIIYDLAVT